MKIEKIANSQLKVSFEIGGNELKDNTKTAYERVKKDISMPGFRKGNVPYDRYVKANGEGSLYQEAMNVLIDVKYQELINNKEFQILSMPEVTTENENEETGAFDLVFTFDVFPSVSLGQYKGMEFTMPKQDVTDEMILEETKKLFPNNIQVSVKEDKDAVIEALNTVVFDFEGFVDDVAFEGGKAENYELKVMSNSFIPGFEEQMLGLKAGDEKDINVKFPEEYHSEDLKGKPAVFKIKIHEIKQEVFVNPTDEEVVALNLNAANFEELLKIKKEELEKNSKQNAEDQLINTIMDKIILNSVLEVPQKFLEEKYQEQIKRYEDMAKQYKISLEQMLMFSGQDAEKFKKDLHEQTEKRVIGSFIYEKLLEEINPEVTDEEVENFNAYPEGYAKANIEQKHEYIKNTKVFDILKSLNTIK